MPKSPSGTHRRGRRTLALATSVAAGAALLGTAPPAAAERAGFADPADASASIHDIRRVVVDHREGPLVVRVRVSDLRARSDGGPASLATWVDTDGTRRGPELLLVTGLQRGTDYQLVRTAGWKPAGEPLTCAHSVRLRPAKDVAVLRIARGCLGDIDRARVAVRMDDAYDADHPVRDWLGAPRSFTRWLARG